MKMFSLLLTFIFSFHVGPTTLHGKVVKVLDGDTLDLLVTNKASDGTLTYQTVRVRFNGIDAPEKSQAFGQKSKEFSGNFCLDKEVKVVVHSTDRYGRSIGDVYVGDKWLNLELVKQGLAWHYKQYSKDEQLAKAEREARESKKGLWSDPSPVAPWDFRRAN